MIIRPVRLVHVVIELLELQPSHPFYRQWYKGGHICEEKTAAVTHQPHALVLEREAEAVKYVVKVDLICKCVLGQRAECFATCVGRVMVRDVRPRVCVERIWQSICGKGRRPLDLLDSDCVPARNFYHHNLAHSVDSPGDLDGALAAMADHTSAPRVQVTVCRHNRCVCP